METNPIPTSEPPFGADADTDIELMFELALAKIDAASEGFFRQGNAIDAKKIVDDIHRRTGRAYQEDGIEMRMVRRALGVLVNADQRRAELLQQQLGKAGDLFAAMMAQTNQAVLALEKMNTDTIKSLNETALRLRLAGTHRATEKEGSRGG